MKIVFLGAPGSGKGTQSGILAKTLGIPAVSTGDIIRNILKTGDSRASVLKSYIDKGELVPSSVVEELLKERLEHSDCSKGYILDGFPRTIEQAEALEKMGIFVDIVIDISVPDDLICIRMLNRLTCTKCGAIFNSETEMRPKVSGICDLCGGSLKKRSDDNEETIRTRLKVYNDQTLPLRNFYKSKNILHSIDGSADLKASSEEILKLVRSSC